MQSVPVPLRSPRRFAVRSAAVLLTVALAAPGGAEPLRLAFGTFDPLSGAPAVPDGLGAVELAPGIPQPFLVQLAGRPTAADRLAIEAAGDLLGYVPEHAYLVRMTGTAADRLAGDPAVRWVGPWLPAFKLSPDIGHQEIRDPTRADASYRILLVRTVGDAAAVRSTIEATGGRVMEAFARRVGQRLIVEAEDSRLPALARLPAVVWIEEKPEFRTWNDRTTWVAQSNASAQFPVWDHGVHGEGQIASVMDSGLDYNSCWFRDPGKTPGPSHRKVIDYSTFGGNPYDGCSTGHGTHVCGTLAGNQTFVNPGVTHANGMAYEAKLALQDVGADDFFSCLLGLVNVPGDLTAAYNASWNLGARVHSNSWGSTSNAYDGYCVDIDEFMWSHPDFLVVFAAGNSGSGTSTVGSPGTAKDCVTVGATRQTPNQESMASYSSRGPSSDGRLKPTVCLPGGDGTLAITSADNATGNPPPNTCNSVGDPFYGTSMATPAVSGSALLVRQYFEDGFYPSGTATAPDGFGPSAALVKAMLVNTAVDIGSADIPNMNEGWGRVLLDDALYFDGDTRELRVEEDPAGLATDVVASFGYDVEAGQALEVVLVWTDRPGTNGTSLALVNDLDLEVEGPTGTIWRGNVFSGGESTTGGSADRRNVEEVVRLATPAAGTYVVRVRAFNIPMGPQPFALAATGAFAAWPPNGAVDAPVVAGAAGTRLDLAVAPNPTRAGATIRLITPGRGPREARVTVYDLRGSVVATPWSGPVGPGVTVVPWDGRDADGRDVPSGVYFVRAQSARETVARKLLVLR